MQILGTDGLGQLPITLEDSVANMMVLDALFHSAESGQWAATAMAQPDSRD